jgi:CheY-like chemotaxis protein/tetratricopeptide (TPR) repeat protein
VSLRILIVEDDKHTRRILEMLLTRERTLASQQPEILIAQDGKEGLAALEKGPVDLIISDLLMPRMDGWQFCKEVRKHPQGAKIPLLITSAIHRDQATITRLRTEYGADFFAKPFQVRELLEQVKRLLSGPVPRGKPAPPATTAAPPPAAAAAAQGGSLADRGPPRVLLDLWDARATGTLKLSRGKVVKSVELLHGTPVSVASNLRTETLGHFLVARGVLTEQRHQLALNKAHAAKERLGRVLVQLGWISDQELLQQLSEQMRQKLINMLRWGDGTWSFTPGEPPTDKLHLPLETPRMVFQGLQRSVHVDQIAQQLTRVNGRIALTMRAERHRESFVRLFGADGLEAMARRPSLTELMTGVDPTPLLVQIDVLIACGMAEIEPAAGAAAPLPDSHDPIALARIVVNPEPQVAVAPAGSLYDELFGETEAPGPAPRPNAEISPSGEVTIAMEAAAPDDDPDADDEPSGVMTLPLGGVASAPVSSPHAPDPRVETLRKEILAEFLDIHGKDYYQVLDLARDAQPEDIAEAYAQVGKRFRLERFVGIDLGRDYARLEELHQVFREAFETLSSRAHRETYDRMLDSRPRPPRGALDAELLSHQAVDLLNAGDATSARKKLEEAVAADGSQADYHALLGWAIFVSESGSATPPFELAQDAWSHAAPHLQHALEIDPDHLEAHDFIGRIAVAVGEDPRGIGHLERVLDVDPGRAETLTALEVSLGRTGDWRRLERTYRKLIHRLGDAHESERALRLWWRLAELYRTRIGDRDSARIAFEIVAKLAPDDPRPREALARLHAEDPASWAKAAQALRESWALAPEDPEPGRALFRLHLQGQRWDAAFVAAAVLACREAEDDGAADFYQRNRPRFLQRALKPIDGALFARVRHSDDDPLLEALFAKTFALLPSPVSLSHLALTAADEVPAGAREDSFERTLGYAASILGVEPPSIYHRADFGHDAHVGATRPPVLIAGSHALQLTDRVTLAFRLGRALTYLLPGRALIGAIPTRQLKATLLAAVTLVQPGAVSVDPEVIALRAQLAAASPTLPRELGPLVEQLLKSAQGTLNLARYAAGLARTADRVGLVLSNDLQLASRIVAHDGAAGAADDLLDFALSEDYLVIREALGLTVAV